MLKHRVGTKTLYHKQHQPLGFKPPSSPSFLLFPDNLKEYLEGGDWLWKAIFEFLAGVVYQSLADSQTNVVDFWTYVGGLWEGGVVEGPGKTEILEGIQLYKGELSQQN